ncbi:hypothetical protein Fmac_015897 [Flemingia macrophylla]|uniref:Bifunctional inhibitor/plant lipid transfer protein/seed storage helical domain-containing protein n=1 Tax=Flemingia macrophylla TaxID=520843 RepID=A0ABD1MG12_9FABA
MLINHVVADSAQETMKCVEQLSGIGSCVPYLGSDAKAPTADCCSGLKQAIKTNKKCVCLVLKHRDDPDLGLKINISIAVGLPSICEIPDNISECPAEESFQNGKKHGADETATAENGASNVGIKGLLQSFVAVLLIWLF